MPHSWFLQNKYLNVGLVMSPGGLNERESSQKFGALSYVYTLHEQYVKLHEHHYLTYIQKIYLHISQNRIGQPTQLLCTVI